MNLVFFNYFLVHQPVVTTSMYLQSNYTPNLKHLQLKVHLKSSQSSAVGPFCENAQHVEATGYFCRRAPLWIFDRILNLTLPHKLLKLKESLEEKLSTTGDTQGNLSFPLPPHSPDLHQKKDDEILD